MPIDTPFAAARKESFWAISSPPISARWIATILPGYGAPNATLRLLPGAVLKDRHEQRLAGEQALARAHQRAEHAALPLGAVAEDGLHLDAVVHVHHPAGLGDRGLLRVQFDFDVLHVVAEDLVLDLVHGHRISSPGKAHLSAALTQHFTPPQQRGFPWHPWHPD